MSSKYKREEDVPTTVLSSRLRELAELVTDTSLKFPSEFNMRIPAQVDRDADLVMFGAACRLARLEAKIAALESLLVSVDERLPPFGDPVLVVIDNVVQPITYLFDASDISDEHMEHWYEPFHFGMDCEEDMVAAKDVTHWMPNPQPPIEE